MSESFVTITVTGPAHNLWVVSRNALRWLRDSSSHDRPIGPVLRRGLIAVIGLVVVVIGLDSAREPFREVREFRAVVACAESSRDCFGHETGLIADRRTHTTPETTSVGSGHSWTSTKTHYEITPQRADGTRHTREVSPGFYDVVAHNQRVDLRLWRKDVVGIETPATRSGSFPTPAHN